MYHASKFAVVGGEGGSCEQSACAMKRDMIIKVFV